MMKVRVGILSNSLKLPLYLTLGKIKHSFDFIFYTSEYLLQAGSGVQMSKTDRVFQTTKLFTVNL